MLGFYPPLSATTFCFRTSTTRRFMISFLKVHTAIFRRECLPHHLRSACALKADLAVLPQGDMTEVGEKGELLVEAPCKYLTKVWSCRHHCRFPLSLVTPHFLSTIPVEWRTTRSRCTCARRVC
jgi:hypothetical protein